MTEPLPDPLVSAEVDLRGMEYMPLHLNKLFRSDTWLSCNAEEKVAALHLWGSAWYQVPAASLPDDDGLLAHMAGCGTAVKVWKKLRAKAMKGFVLCADGRLYHPFLADLAAQAWRRRKEYLERKGGEAERKANYRERLRAAAAALRDIGIVPPEKATLETLQAMLADAETGGVARGQSESVPEMSHGTDGTEARGQVPGGTANEREREVRKKENKNAPQGGEAPLPEEASSPTSDPKKQLYARAREVLGTRSGGMVTKLLASQGDSIALARSVIEKASEAGDPREYLAAVIARKTSPLDAGGEARDGYGSKWF